MTVHVYLHTNNDPMVVGSIEVDEDDVTMRMDKLGLWVYDRERQESRFFPWHRVVEIKREGAKL